MINRIDQKDLLDYVTGETESSVAVKEAEMIFDAVDTQQREAKRPRFEGAAASAADDAADADEAAMAAQATLEEADFLPKCVGVDEVLGWEKVLSTRNSIMLALDLKHFSAVEGLYAATIKRKKEAVKKPKGPSPKAKSNRECTKYAWCTQGVRNVRNLGKCTRTTTWYYHKEGPKRHITRQYVESGRGIYISRCGLHIVSCLMV
jgi:hypothetical protein